MNCIASSRWPQIRLLATAPLLLSSILAYPASAQSIILPEGMAIPLVLRQDISSKTAHVGDPVDLAVSKAITIGGVPVIAAGSPVKGEVVRVRDNGLLGRSGKLNIEVSKVRAGEIEISVRGDRNVKGAPGALGAVGAGLVFLPLAVIVRGKDVKLPAGTAFDVYVDREVAISAASPAAPAEPSGPDPSTTPSTIKSIDPNDAIAGAR